MSDNKARDELHKALVEVGDMYPADSSDIRYVLRLADAYAESREAEARYDAFKAGYTALGGNNTMKLQYKIYEQYLTDNQERRK